jgi:NADH:ubiquinone oxidoreductase subunit F (NADH-binding)/NAD-dependent dihydropyrimidine dehydrogenase PreA subunit
MAIGAYAIGADEGYIYIRKEYPLAMEILENAIRQAREKNLLGKAILGTDFSFDLVIHRGAGAFVCGESSALMTSMSGMPGEPRSKYIHTVESGYKGRPTVLNNVETLANVPRIITRGSKWFASIGTGDVSENPWNGSSGTKVFSLVGDINNAGLVEIPMGITLREIIYDIGGGIPDGREFKAVQTGGPSGGVLPADKLDLPVDFDTLTDAGSMMGSGGMVVMDDKTCMIQIAKYFVDFLKDESCGKCTPCREGLVALGTILERIISGDGRQGDIELLEEYGQNMCETSLCALGQTAANPVLSTIKYFRNEYEDHIREGKCVALKCKALIEYRINAENCTGCTICARNCPVDAIEGNLKEPHMIVQEKCIRCGVCREVCNFNAVEVL